MGEHAVSEAMRTPGLAEWRNTYDEIGRLLFENTLEPTPDNYMLCHRYLTAGDGEFNSLVDRAIAQSGGLTAVAVAAIIAQRNVDLSAADLAEMADEAQDFLLKITQILGQSGEDHRAFGAALEQNASDLEGGAPVAATVDTLVALTRAMIERTREAEDQMRKTGEEISTLRDDLANARKTASTDALTGLPNRRAMDTHLEEAVDAARRNREIFTVAICDIDHFKRFNDTYGHPLGDEVIKFVASSLARTSGEKCFVGRYGGEEFVVMYEGKSPQEVAAILDRIRGEVGARELKITATGKTIGRVTFSAGVSTLERRDSPGAMLKRADAALYRAKEGGRNRVCIDGE